MKTCAEQGKEQKMGIRENFKQAVSELTGGGKNDKRSERAEKSTVNEMRNAVAAEDTGEFDAIRQPSVEQERDEFEEIERRAAEAAASYNQRQGELEGMRASETPQSVRQESSFRQETAQRSDFAQSSASDSNASASVGSASTGNSGNMGGSGNSGNAGSAAGSGSTASSGGFEQTPPPPPAPVSFSTAKYSPADENEITVISKNTVIDGNIRSFANMSIDGNIKGNVETTKDIDLNGKVVGNIACNNAALRASQVQGNVQMKGNVFMERDTLLIGDITSTYANVNGKIKGNLEITGKAELKSDAVVFGDISASTITVNDGAIIQGYVSTTFLNKEESKSIFPDTITIGE